MWSAVKPQKPTKTVQDANSYAAARRSHEIKRFQSDLRNTS